MAIPPTLMTHTKPNKTLLDMTAAAPVTTKECSTMTSRAMQRKTKAARVEKRRIQETGGKTLTIKNSGWEKKAGQLANNNLHATQTLANIVRMGGINIQIVLGNSSLGTTPLE
jgi:hypothetical protein